MADKETLLDRAKAEYPAIKNLDIDYVETPKENAGYLEYWPPDEPGTDEYQRPKELRKGKAGLQVFRADTRPIDVLGDIVSHGMVNDDKTIKKHYADFVDSLTPDQEQRLKEQYEHATKNEGEKRPFKDWKEHTGLPGYFRGYAFQQWAKSREDPVAAELYTPAQMDRFDSMMKYLRGEKEDHPLYDHERSKSR